MDSTAAHQAASPVIVLGQLTLRTIRGRNGRLFIVKEREPRQLYEVRGVAASLGGGYNWRSTTAAPGSLIRCSPPICRIFISMPKPAI